MSSLFFRYILAIQNPFQTVRKNGTYFFYAYPSFTIVKELALNQQVFCVDKENVMYNSYTVFFVLSFFV